MVKEDFFKMESSQDGGKLIADDDKLDLDYIPEEIKHRNREMGRLRREFYHPAIADGKRREELVTGEPGTGKTMLVRYFNQQVKQKNDLTDTELLYINCENNDSEQSMLMTLFEKLGFEYQRGISKSENIDELQQWVQESEEVPANLVITLDEVDKLNKSHANYMNSIIYKLTRKNSLFGDDSGVTVSLLCVSNKDDIADRFDDDVDSSFQYEAVHFQRYTTDELCDIMMQRQKEAFADQILDQQALEIIAEEVKEKFEGDVRAALRILKKTPDKINPSKLDNPEGIDQEKVVNESIREMKVSKIDDVLRGADKHNILLLKSITDASKRDESKLGDLIDRFNRYCEFAGFEKKNTSQATKSYVYRRLNEMEESKILDREKHYDEKQNPYHYYLVMDAELLQEKVHERMKRKGFYEDFVQGYENLGNGDIQHKDSDDIEEKKDEVLDDDEKEKMDALLG